MSGNSFFKPGKNCWRTETANHASLVVDYANYYRDLHESIMKAKHSVFITGWDIDSRIELLRGSYIKEGLPVTLYELLIHKAMENPDLKIYLNRWDYALFMADIREPMGLFKWRGALLPNIYFCRDDMVPFGACHHQKVAVIDDETAYTGGMDVALQRWDMREHNPVQPERVDPGGAYDPHAEHHYGPYHDIMTVVSGPAARALAELSRTRWKIATGYDPVPLRDIKSDDLPPTWPDSDPPDFEKIPVAIARTVPGMERIKPEYTIERMYLDEIARAEHFIYMENQYYTRKKIARALHAQMKKKPNLKLLLVSSYNPQGLAERKIMWAGRIKFYDILKKRGMAKRAVMAYPACKENGTSAKVRIHSKFMIVDDKFMHVGSANLNNRSMCLDTECDLIYHGITNKHCRKIAAIRNDLINEHSGRNPKETEEIIFSDRPVHALIEPVKDSSKFFVAINDKEFMDKSFVDAATKIGDPEGELLSDFIIFPRRHSDIRRFPKQKIIISLILIGLVALLLSLWSLTPMARYITPHHVANMLDHISHAPMAVPLTICLYTLGVLLFAPTAALTAGTAVAFGPFLGFFISITGAIAGSILGFLLGKIIKSEYLGIMMGSVIERVRQQTRDSTVASITFLRMLPVAPFSVVNIALGLVRVPFLSFLAGTLLGFLPGTVVIAFMGGSLARLWEKHDPVNIALVILGIAAWLGAIVASQLAFRHWRHKYKKIPA